MFTSQKQRTWGLIQPCLQRWNVYAMLSFFKDCLSDWSAKIGLVMSAAKRHAGSAVAPSGGVWAHGTTALLLKHGKSDLWLWPTFACDLSLMVWSVPGRVAVTDMCKCVAVRIFTTIRQSVVRRAFPVRAGHSKVRQIRRVYDNLWIFKRIVTGWYNY